MGKILESLQNTVIGGFLLTILIIGLQSQWFAAYEVSGVLYFRYIHVLSGIMWIGLLWYFNFVQIPTMPSVPDHLKPAIGKHIAPKALFWFRWAAMFTLISGLILAMLSGYLIDALKIAEGSRLIGIGMWMAIVMWFNVWFIIWPNQKVALGIIDADISLKPKAARKAMLFSRLNTLLSIPMLICMTGQQNGLAF